MHDNPCGNAGDHELDAKARLAGQSKMRLLSHLEIVVVKADRAEAERDEQNHPNIDGGDVGPQQRRTDDSAQDHQAAHCWRAGLLEVGLRSVSADRLALTLPEAQGIDNLRAKDEDNQRRSDQRATGAESNVAENIEERNLVRKFDKQS